MNVVDGGKENPGGKCPRRNPSLVKVLPSVLCVSEAMLRSIFGLARVVIICTAVESIGFGSFRPSDYAIACFMTLLFGDD